MWPFMNKPQDDLFIHTLIDHVRDGIDRRGYYLDAVFHGRFQTALILS